MRAEPRERGGRARARRAKARPPAAESPAIPRRAPGAIAVYLLVLAAVLASVATQLFDTDMWQHLAVGRAIWTLHRVPTTQLWVWPLYGAPDVNYAWGFEALLWPCWALAGVSGLFLWRALVTLGAFGLAALAARRMGARDLALALVVTLAAVMHRERAFLRPESLVDLLLPLELWVLEGWRQRGGRGVWAIVAIQLAWANLHLSWPLGFLILAAYELDARRARRGGSLLPVAAAALLATFVNPFGWHVLEPPLRYLVSQRHSPLYRMIDELQPLSRRDLARTWGVGFLLGWPLLLLWRARRAGLDLAELSLCLAFTALAIAGVRYLGPYTLVALPFLARDLDLWLRSRTSLLRSPGLRTAFVAISVALIAGFGIVRPSLAGTWTPFGLEMQWRRVPAETCDFMAAQGVRGRGFNAFEQGGYLLFRFWPDRGRLPFLDIHQAGTEQDLADYVAMLDDPAPWRALDRRRRFDWAMTLTPDQADALDADSSFAIVYREDAAVLYVRRDGPLAALAQGHAYRILPGGNRALEQVRQRGRSDAALARALEAETRRAVAESRHDGSALNLLSLLDVEAGRLEDARRHLDQAFRVLPGLPYAQERLGVLALATGHPGEALERFARERARSGLTARLALQTARAWQATGDAGRAASWYRSALRLDPGLDAPRDSLTALKARGAR